MMTTGATRLIHLRDGIVLEVDATEHEVQHISSRTAEHVQFTLAQIQPLLVQACQPVIAALSTIGQDAHIAAAELELGFSFEGEGNRYIARFTGGATLLVRISLTPRSPEETHDH